MAKQIGKSSVDNDERRYFPRWEVNNRICYRLEPKNSIHECRSRDLNCCGTCLLTNQSLPPNQKLRMTVYLAEDVSVQVEGKVLWTKPQENDQYLVGVNFLETSKKIQDLILNHAFEINKKDLVRHWFEGWNGKTTSDLPTK